MEPRPGGWRKGEVRIVVAVVLLATSPLWIPPLLMIGMIVVTGGG